MPPNCPLTSLSLQTLHPRPQMANEGMPHHNFPSQHGAMHVKFIVDLPAQLSKEQKEALDKILARP